MLETYRSLKPNWSYPTLFGFRPSRIAELAEPLKTAGIAGRYDRVSVISCDARWRLNGGVQGDLR
jgi:hypothetical protein